jgi:hypothetical protein
MTLRGRHRGDSENGAWLEVDAELDALLDSDSELAARPNAFKAEGNVPPSEEVAQYQIRMMAEAVRLAGSGRFDGKQALSQRRLTKKRWFGASLAASVGWKIAIGSVAVAATTAAATGSLPDPVQSGLSAAASRIGIVLPDGHEGQAGVDQAELSEVELGQANQAESGQPIQLDEPGDGQSDQGNEGQASQP